MFAICDDKPLHRERLARSVQNHLNGQHAELRLFASPAALLQEISAHGYTPVSYTHLTLPTTPYV